MNSLVFAAAEDKFGTPCCIKLEPADSCDQISNEIEVLPKLCGCPGVPNLLIHGTTMYQEMKWIGIVTDVVGDFSLKDVIKKNGYLNQQEVLNYANRAIDILQAIHSRGFIYGDFKPEHFIFCKGTMYLIDYGSAVPSSSSVRLATLLYASLDVHIGAKLDFKSDFESLWYVLLSLCQPLPWESCTSPWDVMTLKSKLLPEKMYHEYPILSKLFLSKMGEEDIDE